MDALAPRRRQVSRDGQLTPPREIRGLDAIAKVGTEVSCLLEKRRTLEEGRGTSDIDTCPDGIVEYATRLTVKKRRHAEPAIQQCGDRGKRIGARWE